MKLNKLVVAISGDYKLLGDIFKIHFSPCIFDMIDLDILIHSITETYLNDKKIIENNEGLIILDHCYNEMLFNYFWLKPLDEDDDFEKWSNFFQFIVFDMIPFYKHHINQIWIIEPNISDNQKENNINLYKDFIRKMYLNSDDDNVLMNKIRYIRDTNKIEFLINDLRNRITPNTKIDKEIKYIEDTIKIVKTDTILENLNTSYLLFVDNDDDYNFLKGKNKMGVFKKGGNMYICDNELLGLKDLTNRLNLIDYNLYFTHLSSDLKEELNRMEPDKIFLSKETYDILSKEYNDFNFIVI
jgi:hypothetical protein